MEVRRDGVVVADSGAKVVHDSITFRLIRNSDSLVRYIRRHFSGDSLNVLLALNRLDADHLHRPDSLIFPSRYDSLIRYSPLPLTLKETDTLPKLILIVYRLQAAGIYEYGKLSRWMPVSMGKRSTPTPTGLFHTNWKAKSTVSTEDPEWILNWYFNIENFRGVSMHEYELPGYPASHACIRMLADDAKYIYYWADQWILDRQGRIVKNGTPVAIVGNYAFGKRRPWRNVADFPSLAKMNEEERVACLKAVRVGQ